MSKFHITAKGEAGVCRAETRGCPLGGESDHYSNADEARSAYEASEGAAAPVAPRRPHKYDDYTAKEEVVETLQINGELVDFGGYEWDWMDSTDRAEWVGEIDTVLDMESEAKADGYLGDAADYGNLAMTIEHVGKRRGIL